jgi:hypothetical protein
MSSTNPIRVSRLAKAEATPGDPADFLTGRMLPDTRKIGFDERHALTTFIACGFFCFH